MRQLFLTAVAATVLAGGSLLATSANAAPVAAGSGIGTAVDLLNPLQNVAICWYDDGWNGPAWYECGRWRNRGIGFFGFDGWNGRWHNRGPRNKNFVFKNSNKNFVFKNNNKNFKNKH